MWLLMLGLSWLTTATTATGIGHFCRLSRFASNSATKPSASDGYLRNPLLRYRQSPILFSSSLAPPKKLHADIVLGLEEKKLFEMLKKVAEVGGKNCSEATILRVAGGWIRDKLLGVEGKTDIDITVSNMSGKEFVEQLNWWLVKEGKQALNYGVIKENPEKSKHLETVAISIGPFAVDFSNLRTENYTEDSRVPRISRGTPEEDARRRDLTINSLYFNLNSGIVEDYTGSGINDLENGLIRTPLPSVVTLRDDPLRALRAVRFACRFQFKIVDEFLDAFSDNEVMESLNVKVSRERIKSELESMLRESTASRALGMMYKLGIFAQILRVYPYITDKRSHRYPQSKNVEVQMNLSYGVAKSMVLSELCRLLHYDSRIITTLHIHGEDAKLLRMAAIISFCADDKYTHPAKTKKTISFLEHILTEDLKINNRDKKAVHTLLEASCAFRVPVRKKFEESGDSGITRLELGKSIRKAGANYQYALALAMATEILERTQYILKLKNYEDLVNAIFPNFDCCCDYVDYNLDKSITEFEHFALSTLSEQTKIGSACFMNLEEIIRKFNIQNSWAMKPMLNGNVIKEKFPKLPEWRISEVMQSQIDWMIDNPAGTETEVSEYIHKIYEDFA